MNALRLVLLGDDPLLAPLLGQISAAPSEFSLRMAGSGLGTQPGWEELLQGSEQKLVLVGRGPAEVREDQLRRLIQERVPVVAVHPAAMDPLFCYELDMICRENGCFLRHYYPGQAHPLLLRLKELVQGHPIPSFDPTHPLGQIEQVTFDRPMLGRDQPAVLDQLARDIDLIITLCGQQNSVSAWGAGQDERTYAALSVQFSGPGGFITRWNVLPAEEGTSPRITVLGTRGKALLTMPADLSQWQLEIIAASGSNIPFIAPEWTVAEEPLAVLHEIKQAAEQVPDPAEERRRAAERQQSGQPNSRWFQACQSIDLLEAVGRSVLKGRTIELHFEDYSSPSTFKGRMSAIGCTMLLLGMMTCCLGLLTDMFGGIYHQVVRDKNLPREIGLWPFVLLAILLAFLIIQVLPKFLPEPVREDPDQQEDAGERIEPGEQNKA